MVSSDSMHILVFQSMSLHFIIKNLPLYFSRKTNYFFKKCLQFISQELKHSITKTEQKTNLLLRSNKTFEVIHFSKSLKSTRNYVHKLLFPKQTNEHKKKVTREESFIHKAIFLSASLQSHDFFCLRAEINRAIKENHRLLNFFSLHLQIAITSILKTFCRDLLTVNEAKVPFVFFLPSTQSMHKRFSFT